MTGLRGGVSGVPAQRTATGIPGETTRRYRPRQGLQVIAVVPACNEAHTIRHTIRSLRQQTRPPDQIVVVPNNCTDDTAGTARREGAYVLEYPGHNPDRKAGAINFALDRLAPYLDDPWKAAVLVMDADTTLSATFIDTATQYLTSGVGGVGGTFAGRDDTSVLGHLQRMEYHRYGHVAARMNNRAFVLTGTGTLFNYGALLDVRRQRRAGTLLPEGQDIYDTHSLTEDNELTFALQVCGYGVVAPPGMSATTDVMDTVAKLVGQRERWYLGAMRNIARYGRRMPFHLRWIYWRQQAGLLLSALVAGLYLVALGASLIWFGTVQFSWWWTVPSIILLAERVWSVWGMGWKARLYAAAFLPEQLYTLLLTFIYLRALASFVRGRKGTWAAT